MAKPTRLTGSQEPFQIFSDTFFDHSTPMMSHAPMPAVQKPQRRPLGSANSNIVLNPPSSSSTRHSPSKAPGPRQSSSPLTALNPTYSNNLGTVTMAPPSSKRQNTTDSLQKRPYLSNFKTAQKPTMAHGNMVFGKENMHPHMFPMAPTMNFEGYGILPQKGPGKRILMDAAPIMDSRVQKKPKLDSSGLPAHDSFPVIIDDGQKPGHSYAQLIGMAIMRSPNRRLTLSQIYKWISDTYKFYKAEEAGWQNSIRHNLSLHKAFIKVERPKDDPGKGNYWTIQEGMEMQFIKEKPTRKNASTAENLPVMSTRLEPPIQPIVAPMPEPTLPPPLPMTQHSLPPLPTSQATLPAEISSDATIPVSDPAAPEDAPEKSVESEAHFDQSTYSPLPAAMHSSPPVPRHVGSRSRTPPPATRVPPTSSIGRSHKRKFASMDDSGYISSLESSVMRPNQKNPILTSEADRPRSKRSRAGRAELEIARLRASSYESPSKGRSFNVFPPSSSPFRGNGQMLPPLTPAMKLKPLQKPPPSASPNTNLQIHRDNVRAMLQSPLRKMTGVNDETAPWSPAFNLDDTTTFYDMNDHVLFGDMGIWTDMDDGVFAGAPAYESPCKKSAKRPRIDRTQSATALGEASHANNITSTPLLKLSNPPHLTWDTPSKVFSGFSSPSKILEFQSPCKAPSPRKLADMYDMSADSFFPGMFDQSIEFPAEEAENFPLDICQGFQKIGSGSQSDASKDGTKPTLGRSYTTHF